MEILYNIWNVLIHENETLIKIINIPFIFIELYIAMLLFTHFLKINYSKKQSLIYIISLSTIGILTSLLIPNPYNTFINIIALPIMVLVVFKTTFLVAVLSELIQYILFFSFGSILTNICTIIFKISSDQIIYVPIYKISYSVLLYSTLIVIYFLLRKSRNNINLIQTIKKHDNSFTLLLNFIIGTIAICLESYIAAKYIDTLPFSLILSNISVLLIYFIISIYSLSRTINLEKTTEHLEEQKLYNKTLTILYDNIRGFKHDFNNIVQSIGGYISCNNIEGLNSYYSELLKDCQTVNNLTILSPEVINNPAIHSLLTAKYHKATELGIKVNLEAFLDLTTLKVNIYEFTRILGILLDNAIEASSTSMEKIINIIIRKESKANRSSFTIENTYSNKDVNINKIFDKGCTSKTTTNHGLGLWEVRKLLKKNTNLNLYTSKDTMLFKQQLEIYNEKL